MTTRSDKMATWPIPKLLFSMGIPAVISMLIQALYNIVDTIYISNYSQDAMFAIGLVFPMQMIGLSLALGTGVGIGTLVSRRLGEGNKKEATHVATTGILLGLFHALLILLLGVFGAKPFLEMFTTRADIIGLGYAYLLIVMSLNIGQMLAVSFERILQSQGNMIVPMITLIMGAVTNIILDPVLIFGMFGLPAMGIKGAAIATVIGQIISMLADLFFVLHGKHEVNIQFKGFKFDMRIVKDIYSVGIPTAIMNMIGSVTTTLMNGVLVNFTENAVTSLSLYFKLQSFVFMPVFGFNQGALPILAYNYGAKNKKRYLATAKLYLLTAVCFLTSGMLLFRFKTDLMLSFFEMNDELKAIAEVTLRTISLSFIPAAISIAITTMFQSFGKGTISMIQSILRQLGFLIPAAYLLSNISLEAIWYAYPIAETAVVIIFVPMIIKLYHNSFEGAE
ncbi:MAG: MATE family efflux transporter [Erysipelotrichaceae bacterium]